MVPETTIIITGYNQVSYIVDAIASVEAQSSTELECIVIDDGSSDGTGAVASLRAANDPRITVLTQKNQGPSAARNHGARHASPSSRYIAFLDGDDAIAPHFIEMLSAYLDDHPKAGVVTCAFIPINGAGFQSGHGQRTRFVPGWLGFPRRLKPQEYRTPFVSFFCATGQGPFALFRRSIFQQTDGYDEGFWPHEDTDMFCQMALLAEIHHLEVPLYLKREHVGGILQTKTEDAVLKFSAFKPDAYGMFRAKWDARRPCSPREAALLMAARRHYYTRHQPMRDLKVALISLPSAIRARDVKKFSWIKYLFSSAFLALLRPSATVAAHARIE